MVLYHSSPAAIQNERRLPCPPPWAPSPPLRHLDMAPPDQGGITMLQNGIPLDRPRRRAADISDIRDEIVTEEIARHKLSSYVVIRMQKYDCRNEVDDEGCPMRPTWQRVSRVREVDISHEEAARRIHELDGVGESVCFKKSEFGPSVRRQIEKAQEDLEADEPDPRYEYVIAQLEWQDKKVPLERPAAKKGKKGKAKADSKPNAEEAGECAADAG
ncbi:hypothetical protein XA68_15869 [Ophiocordyceps unilateralis]|uniref:Uncharacterized protein n=1 Tax=Ophiocordyceps unilateralis TaxID=268505 RepID=A0A2A9PP02_OPHUN|nr:hypothetical protein XA68_15869 [Ophiocordyceps unilateralis]